MSFKILSIKGGYGMTNDCKMSSSQKVGAWVGGWAGKPGAGAALFS